MTGGIFRHKKDSSGTGIGRFKTQYFQSKIKEARGYQRAPRIAPQAKTGILLDRFRLSKKLLFFFFLVVCAAGTYVIFFSGLLDVKNIFVEGTKIIPKETIQAWAKDYLSQAKNYRLLPGNNLLTLDKASLEETLKDRTSRIAAVLDLNKHFPDSITLTIQERTASVIYKNSLDKNYLLSRDGVVLETVPASFASSTEQTFLLLKAIDSEKFNPGEVVPFKKTVEYFSIISSLWEENVPTGLQEGELPSTTSNDLYIKSQEGWTAYFDVDEAPEKQIQALELVLNNEIPTQNRINLAYVDLRIPDLVYYCYYNEPCSVSGGSADNDAGTESSEAD